MVKDTVYCPKCKSSFDVSDYTGMLKRQFFTALEIAVDTELKKIKEDQD